MSEQIIPLDTSPNQTFRATLDVDGESISLEFFLSYNEIAGYWVMTITDATSGVKLLESVPLLTGDYPAGNMLSPHKYMEIGSAYILNMGGVSDNHPDDQTLGDAFVLAWDDARE